jgi:hypothetical protein
VVLSLKRTLYQRLFSANQNNQRAPFVSGLVLVPSDLLKLDFPLLEETVCCLPLYTIKLFEGCQNGSSTYSGSIFHDPTTNYRKTKILNQLVFPSAYPIATKLGGIISFSQWPQVPVSVVQNHQQIKSF